MRDAVSGRFKHWKAVLSRPGRRYFIALPLFVFAVFQAFQSLRDEFLSSSTAAKLKVPALIAKYAPGWLAAIPWYGWLIGGLLLVMFMILESVHQELTKREADASAQNGSHLADLSIVDLFFFIDADVLEFRRAHEIGQQILDRLSLGQITAYGREANYGISYYVGSPTLIPIPQEFWKNGTFTYQFFGEDRQNDIHATGRGDDSVCYRDVRFTASEIVLYWKKSKTSEQISAIKAIYLAISQSEWAKEKADNWRSLRALAYETGKEPKEIRRRRVISAFEIDIHNRLRSGKLFAWGQIDRKRPLAKIPAEGWDRVRILMEDFDFQQPDWSCAGLISPEANVSRTIIYMDLRFSKDEFFRTYPLLVEPYEK